jgi:hypothetical protein
MVRRLGVLALLAVAACKDTPSFRVRWHLQSRDDLDADGELDRLDVTRAIDCTSLGINEVQISSIDGNGEIVDARIFPCFTHSFAKPHATVGGPALPAGPYAIEVRGVQRNGEPWQIGTPSEGSPSCDPNAKTIGCTDADVACACRPFDAVDDETKDFGFVLLGPAPLECIDGIDNDKDGLVDAEELSCTTMPTAPESTNVTRIQFRLIATVWDGAPQVSCDDVHITAIAARLCPIDDQGQPSCDAAPFATPSCIAGSPVFFQGSAEPGHDYAVELTGIDFSGNALTRPELSPTFHVDNSGIGATVMLSTDFGVDDLLTPLHEPIHVIVGFQRSPDADAERYCTPGNDGFLEIDQVVYELRDAHGGVLDTTVGLPNPPSADFNLDGVPSTCTQQEVTTYPVDWGGYTLHVEARAPDGTVCFTTGDDPNAKPLSLFPGGNLLVVPRVFEGGVPPPSCRDCDTAADCDHAACVDGICVP